MKKILVLSILSLLLVGCVKNASIQQKKEESQVTIKSDKKIDNIVTENIINENKHKTINSEDIYFNVITSAEYSVSDELTEMDKHSDAILYVNVVEKLDTVIETRGAMPTTTFNTNVIEVLKGTDIPENLNINLEGGIVSLKEYKEKNFPSSNEKMGLNKLSEEELESKYISLFPEEYTDFEIGKNYLVFLYKTENLATGNEEYYALIDGLSIYEPSTGVNSRSAGFNDLFNKHNNKVLSIEEVKEVVVSNQ